jgi:hypothetical protein
VSRAFEIQAEAYRAFDRWRAEHDPDGTMDILEASVAYSEWANTHSIAPYLDDAVLPSSRDSETP